MGGPFLRPTAKCSCLESLFVLLIYVYVLFLSVAKLGARPFRDGMGLDWGGMYMVCAIWDLRSTHTPDRTQPHPNSSCA